MWRAKFLGVRRETVRGAVSVGGGGHGGVVVGAVVGVRDLACTTLCGLAWVGVFRARLALPSFILPLRPRGEGEWGIANVELDLM